MVAYLPLAGFCAFELNPAGALHAYITPPDEERFSVEPTQAGFGFAEAETIGPAFTVTVAEA